MRKLLSLILSLMMVTPFLASCSDATKVTPMPEDPDPIQLVSPANLKVQEDYQVSWQKVEEASSYAIKVDNGKFQDVGNVVTYDASELYGEILFIKAVGDGKDFLDSKVVSAKLDNRTLLYTSFEETDWSSSTLGGTKILGLSDKVAKTGKQSLKVFSSNQVDVGGIYLDAGFYAPGGAIDWDNLESISVWFYVDNKEIEELNAYADQLNAQTGAEIDYVNDELKNSEYFYGMGGAYMSIFYLDETGKESEHLFNTFDATKLSYNTWYKCTVDVSNYNSVSDFMIRMNNSLRSFSSGLSGDWREKSPFSHFTYYDDITVTYKDIVIPTPENIRYDGTKLQWDAVESAQYYEVSFDNVLWTKVTETSVSAPVDSKYMLVRAGNDREYSTGEARYVSSDIGYLSNAEAEKLDLGDIILSKSAGATVNDTISWAVVEGATNYMISTDGEKWEYIGLVNTYDITRIYNTNKLYLKAITYGLVWTDSNVKEIDIDRKVGVAATNMSDASAHLSQNNAKNGSARSTNTDLNFVKYGTNSIKLAIKSPEGSKDAVAYDGFFKRDTLYKAYEMADLTKITAWVYLEMDTELYPNITHVYSYEAFGSIYNWSSGLYDPSTDSNKPYPVNTWVQMTYDLSKTTAYANANGFRIMVRPVARAFNEGTNDSSTIVAVDYNIYWNEVQLWY